MTEPASIRYKNPGAMWGGNAISKKWGETGNVSLNDGLGQGNRIAVFPTYVQGICAQLDLWRTSKKYRNKRFADAIDTWSGHNNVPSYIAFCKARVTGLTEDTIMNDAFWKGPMGVAFLKAQAWHEAGKKYPAPDADWIEAQKKVLGESIPETADITVATSTPLRDTKWLQTSLNLLGANPKLDVDGIVGPALRAGIASFQSLHGLDDDGLVGPGTMRAIETALAEPLAIPKPPEIKLPPPGQVKPGLAPTFWGRVANLFKPKA